MTNAINMDDDPFALDSTSGSTGDPFGAFPNGDPFSDPVGGGSFGPAPRFADLGGRLLALHIRDIEERQKYNTPGVLESTGIIDIGVLDGGMIMAPPDGEEVAKQPFGAPPLPMRECGMPPMLFPRRFVNYKGVLNQFKAVTKIKNDERIRYIFKPDGTGSRFLLGRLGKMLTDKKAADHLGINLNRPATEADLKKVADWLATGPTEELVKQAGAYWTLVPVSPEARALAVAWVHEHPEFVAP